MFFLLNFSYSRFSNVSLASTLPWTAETCGAYLPIDTDHFHCFEDTVMWTSIAGNILDSNLLFSIDVFAIDTA